MHVGTIHACVQQWPARSLVWTSDPTPFLSFETRLHKQINDKKGKQKKIVFISFNTKFYRFIHWRQSQEYLTLWIAQYLPTPKLGIFIGEYSLTPESRIL
jgi:hypothetical protein